MLGGGRHLELLELVRFIQLVGNSLSQEGIQLMSLEDPPPRPLHYIPEIQDQRRKTRRRSPVTAKATQEHHQRTFKDLPEHTAHEQQMLWDLCWVEEGWAVRAQAGQKSPGSPGAVFAGPAQPQAPQIGTGPLPETKGWDQFRSQG